MNVKGEKRGDFDSDGEENDASPLPTSSSTSSSANATPSLIFNINGGVSKSFSQNAESRRFNLRLIRLVRDRPELYDLKCPAYKRATERDRGWKEVASELEQDLEFVRTRWKTMRDRFKKECRKYERHLPVTWTHFHEMSFLQPFFRFKSVDNSSQVIDYDTLTARGARDTLSEKNTTGDTYSGSEHNYLDGCVQDSTKFLMDLLNYNQQQQGNGEDDKQRKKTSRLEKHKSEHENDNEDGNGNDDDEDNNNGDDDENNNNNTCGFSQVDCDEESISAGSSPSADNDDGVTSNITTLTYGDNRKRTCSFSRKLLMSNQSKRFKASVNFPAATAVINTNGYSEADDDEEDLLFCRIMLKKLKKMDEHVKEGAKAKILELLVRIQYGEKTTRT